MDTLTPEHRKKAMRAVKSSNTTPEIRVRKLLHAAGFRFRLHGKNLPGTPDIFLPRYKVAVFVHGCFWHQHYGCKRSTRPASSIDYWRNKLDGNVRRDSEKKSQLELMGWKVIVVWECELKDSPSLTKRLTREIVGAQ